MSIDFRAGGAGTKIELLTIRELASALRISRTSAYRLVERRDLPFYKVGGALRFRWSDVEEFLSRGRVESKHSWE